MPMVQPYSIYIHIPFCRARCKYCAFSSNVDFGLQQAYFDKLCSEIATAYAPVTDIKTLFVGGGTPTSVDGRYLMQVFDAVRKRFRLADDCEITCEANPESASADKIRLLAEQGVNRVSFGLQSVNDGTLAKIGRKHTYADFLRAMDNATAAGITNVNADVIIGLPETHADFTRTLTTVTSLPLTHLSMYALEIYPDTPMWQIRDECPTDEDYLADLYDEGVATFATAGFARYETSNFARDGKQCRHNLNYWREGHYYGFGASASGFVGNVRYTNARSIADYIAADNIRVEQENESLTEQAREYAMLALRLDEGVDEALFKRRYGKPFSEFFPAATKLFADGFLENVGGHIRIPADKAYVANSILELLL